MKDSSYLEAEQKIQQALKSGATELDISDSDDNHLQGDCHLTSNKGGNYGGR